MRRLAGLLLCLVLPIAPLRAQTISSAAKKAAGAITSDGVKHRIYVIADDSMGGRDTPSRGLDLTAEYVASEFKRFGLKPAGDEGGYLQRYPIQMSRIDPANSTVEFTQNTGTKITISFNRGAFTLFGSAHSKLKWISLAKKQSFPMARF